MKSKSFAAVFFATALAAPPAIAHTRTTTPPIPPANTGAAVDLRDTMAARVTPVALAPVANADQQGGVRRPPSGGGGGGGRSGGGSGSGGGGGAVRREGPPPSQPSSGGDRASGRRDQGRPGPGYAHAVPRQPGSRPIYVYRPSPWPWYYDPWWGYGGLGVGYAYYSPWNWYGPGWGPGYGAGYGGYGYRYGSYDGKVRLKVTPRDAEVYVDGYYAGTVDDFDGTFQGLRLDPGGYKIEIRKPGFETLTYDVRVQSDRTITFRGEMQATP